jgi:putative thioredoxin
MQTHNDIIDVTEASFQYEVLSFSQNTPVVVDFWATWCRPCKTLGPLLERLAIDSQGRFRLARVDVDANPNLALRYNVRSIPTVKAFSQGEIVSEFVGLQPENRLREFINKLTPPGPNNLALEKANSLLLSQQWNQAEAVFRDASQSMPDDPECLLGLTKSLLAQNKTDEALIILHNFPPSSQLSTIEMLKPLAESLRRLNMDQLPDETILDTTFMSSVRLFTRGNLPAALDGLLDILRQDKSYRDGLARQVIVALLELMDNENPQTRQYRNELASILF